MTPSREQELINRLPNQQREAYAVIKARYAEAIVGYRAGEMTDSQFDAWSLLVQGLVPTYTLLEGANTVITSR